jgi:hypothetical protein
LKKWTERRSGALCGFAEVELASGLIISGLRIMRGERGLWVAMPAQKQADADGNPRLDANGKALYEQIIAFRDRKTSDRFGAMVIALVSAAHPGSLE